MMSVNAFCMMLYDAGIGPVGIQPAWNQTAIETNLDANQTLADYSWETAVYSDYIYSALTLLGVLWGLVTGFPSLLTAAGVPSFIALRLYGVWLLITFIAFIGGRIGGQDN